MTTQQEWESAAYLNGMERFFDSEMLDRHNGKMDGTAVGSSVIRQRVLEIGQALEEYAAQPTAGRGGAYVKALRVAATRYDGEEFYQDYNIPAYIGLITVLQRTYSKSDKVSFLTGMAATIGARLEYDQQLYVFRQDHAAFVGTIEDSLAQQGVSSLSHKLKTYQKKWRDADMRWDSWGDVRRTHVGIRVIKAILEVMDDCFVLTKKHDGAHKRHYIDTTLEFDDFVIKETDLLSRTLPEMLPMIEPPQDWCRSEGSIEGGFYTQPLKSVFPFIKTSGKDHKEFVDAAYPYKHITAVNAMQRTGWKVNQPVVDAVLAYSKMGVSLGRIPRYHRIPIPPHPGDDASDEDKRQWMVDAKRVYGKNKENAAALIVLGQSIKVAKELGDREFWFAYNCDFRGRIYCSSTVLSVQGADHIRAMLKFSNGKRLGREGIRWTAINGANKYGFDKVSYNDRVRWCIDNREHIQEVVQEPTSSRARSFLAEADKPLQFLAWCFEWAATDYGTNPDAEGYLPVGLDGSCNGLQHYSALLRDTRGGSSVNLTDAEIPSDIYGDVAEEFLRVLPQSGVGARFHAIGPDRKLAKRPVMTLPYGSTQQSCRSYIREYIGDNALKFNLVDRRKEQWKLAAEATPYMWGAIGSVVVAAREAMAWLQTCASLVAKEGVYARWTSPAGFPVYQHYAEYDEILVRTDLFGRVKVSVRGEPLGVSKVRARNSVAPNYVHSFDSSHMVMTVVKAASEGIEDFAMVHDDFGVHAADTPRLFDIIRETFVDMYEDFDWLMAWKKEMERLDDRIALPDPPETGELDIRKVLDSKYFFG